MRVSRYSRLLILTIVVSAGVVPLAEAQRPGELVKLAVKIVPPEYPYEARRSRITGYGVVFGAVDYHTSKVTAVKMEKSTGNRILDQASLSAFSQWQFKPKTIRQFRTPVNFEMVGSQAEAMEKVRREQAASTRRSR